tara:strand:+ start:158 stop:604 length:447 start_codon:yes stop_codon:yes gene_type:complete
MKQQITDALKTAMRARDKIALSALRGLNAAIKNEEIAVGGSLDEARIQGLVRSQVKQLNETIQGFTAAGRGDEAEEDQAKVAVLEAFLPQPLSEAEIDALIAEAMQETGAATMKDMGRVMGLVNSRAAGRAEGRVVATKVKAALAAGN